jgi:hypothetical protein
MKHLKFRSNKGDIIQDEDLRNPIEKYEEIEYTDITDEEMELIAMTLVKVSIMILLSRILFTFIFSLFYAESWHFDFMWGFFPVIAFNANWDGFTKINSYSILATTIVIFIFFLRSVNKEDYFNVRFGRYIWYLGIWTTLIQFGVALYLNQYLQFSTNSMIAIPLTVMVLYSTIIVFKERIRGERILREGISEDIITDPNSDLPIQI